MCPLPPPPTDPSFLQRESLGADAGISSFRSHSGDCHVQPEPRTTPQPVVVTGFVQGVQCLLPIASLWGRCYFPFYMWETVSIKMNSSPLLHMQLGGRGWNSGLCASCPQLTDGDRAVVHPSCTNHGLLLLCVLLLAHSKCSIQAGGTSGQSSAYSHHSTYVTICLAAQYFTDCWLCLI